MDSLLFDPARHEVLAGGAWHEPAARDAITRMAARCHAACDPQRGWLSHPLDDPDTPDERVWPLYHGAAGVVWALRQLVREGALPAYALPDDAALWPVAADRAVAALGDHRHGTASLLLGEVGARLLQCQLSPPAARAVLLARLAELVDANAANPCWEPLWGGSGTVLAAIWLAEGTGASAWANRVREGAQALFNAMDQSEAAADGAQLPRWGWTQQLYGRSVDYLGAGHGLAGNVFPFVRGAAFLPPDQVQCVLDRVLPTLQACAQHGRSPDGRPMLNWGGFRQPPPGASSKRLVQDCHGAAGIVVRLAGVPRGADWDALLLAAGETVWQAGPLAKGPGLCHGSAGNGFALLKLWWRTGDALWLARARAFAMHAIAQVDAAAEQHGRGRPSLWTGDPGVALFLWRCIQGGHEFPTLDHFGPLSV